MKLNFSRSLVSTLVIVAIFGVQIPNAFAASLTTLSDTMSSLKISAPSNHDISFVTPTGVAAGATIIVTLPGAFAIPAGLTFTDVDVLDNGTNVTLAAAPAGATWGVVRTSATVLTITNGTTAVVPGRTIRIKVGTNATNQTTGVNQITNDTTTGTKSIALTGTFGDTGNIAVQMITDDTVVVTAVVPQTLSFALSANSIAYGNLDAAAARFANTTTGSAADTVAHTVAIGTNGTGGYSISVQGGTLTSGANTITAVGAVPAASTVGTEQFGIYATKAGGVNGTIAAPYATASSFGYNGSAASAVTFASGTSATATETFSLHYVANIAALTEAGTYTTNLTYVGTANF
jgi:hypothetical protein